MLLDFFLWSPWPGVVLWATLYTSDLLLTIACARMYQHHARNYVSFEGSFEITPYYQKDVDRLRRFSPRFLIALAATCGIHFYLWWITIGGSLTGQDVFMPDAYLFALGAMILVELTIHVRHLRNYSLFRAIATGDAVTGHIEYRRPVMLRLSSVEIVSFAVLYAVIYAVTENSFVLGGTFACAALALNHLILAARAKTNPEARTPNPEPEP